MLGWKFSPGQAGECSAPAELESGAGRPPDLHTAESEKLLEGSEE